MPCSRQTAILRLIAMWCARTSEDDDLLSFHIRLGDVLQDIVINTVMLGDLFADLDNPAEQPEAVDRETQRRRQLIRAWLKPRTGGVQ